jgi:hypothetical protein
LSGTKQVPICAALDAAAARTSAQVAAAMGRRFFMGSLFVRGLGGSR